MNRFYSAPPTTTSGHRPIIIGLVILLVAFLIFMYVRLFTANAFVIDAQCMTNEQCGGPDANGRSQRCISGRCRDNKTCTKDRYILGDGCAPTETSIYTPGKCSTHEMCASGCCDTNVGACVPMEKCVFVNQRDKIKEIVDTANPTNRSPGERCDLDKNCAYGCCVNGTCAAKCKCPNAYWNSINGCTENNQNSWNNSDKEKEQGSQCSYDSQCKYGCCAGGQCQEKCKCPNYMVNKVNGCPWFYNG